MSRRDSDRPLGRVSLLGAAALALLLSGCPTAGTLQNARPATADKWFQRAQQDFKVADIEDARDAVKRALAIVPDDPEVRKLAARIALAQLDYAETIRLLKGIKGSEASGLRGRALWYKGDLEAAADQLDAMLNDPDVVDDWAKGITKLARRGAGRTPFALSGALLAAVELPHVSPLAPFFVVPVEIDGESALAMISTGNAEVVLDSATRPEPSWISLRFGKKLEVHDVPALTQDLSGISKQMGAPIKALLGVNLLRHLHATIDYDGHQFVARSFSPPPPPDATRVDLSYIRGGGMILRGKFGGERGEPVSLLLDTSMTFPLALDEGGWKKAGSVAKDLKIVAEDPEQKLREGVVPMVRLGAFDVPKVPGVFGTPVDQIERQISLDIDGVLGTGLLAPFRVTFGDQGRLMWLEDTTLLIQRILAESGSGQPLPDDPMPGMPDPLSPFGPQPGLGNPGGLLAPPGGGLAPAPAPGGNAPPGGAKPPKKAPER
ncbi:tetratricopeptide repeat protein [Polyangium sorediatum]|uniref:Tetratricopeptide repeat protein n=1 Tax=Polyangium sorediatum TaxID=889274 RepID=A0ABT6NT76_9BACT|nr:hypothetical protein [Polyangium sorediatum]MDI1431512.1 hypothetical protein [Polyangium sorediatum]